MIGPRGARPGEANLRKKKITIRREGASAVCHHSGYRDHQREQREIVKNEERKGWQR